MRRLSLSFTVAVLALAALTAWASDPPGNIRELPRPDAQFGRSGVLLPDSTAAGVWDGTWMYLSRDSQMAFWMRTQNGVPQMKLQYQSLAAPEAFETDWDGKAVYYIAGQPATYEIKLSKREKDALEGTWSWDVQFPDSGRAENGQFAMYRAGDGRSLVVRFDAFERTVRRGDQVTRYDVAPVWTFRKASKRLVLWDELPF